MAYDVSFAFEAREYGDWEPTGFKGVARPPRIRAGDLLVVEVRRLTALRVKLVPEGDGWEEGFDIRVHLTLGRPDGTESASSVVRVSKPVDEKAETILWDRPGFARLAWDGEHVVAGTMDALIDFGGTATADVPLRLRPGVFAGMERIPLVFEEESLKPEDRVEVTGHPMIRAEEYPLPGFSFELRDASPLPAAWRVHREVVVSVGREWASNPLPIPRTGPLRVPLVPAGMLMLVPEAEVPEEMGRFRLRRRDGHPIPVPDREAEWSFARVRTGQMLGPLPAGTYEFEVFAGRTKIKEVRTEVRPGRTLPLVIPE
jgi:hypothetical protein